MRRMIILAAVLAAGAAALAAATLSYPEPPYLSHPEPVEGWRLRSASSFDRLRMAADGGQPTTTGAPAAGADELAELRNRVRGAANGFSDLRAIVVVQESNRRELEKMGKVFAETYQFKKANVAFALPDRLKINGALGVVKVEFITAGNTRKIRIPSVRFKKQEDITLEQEKRMTSIEVGVVTDPIFDIYSSRLIGTEQGESGETIYVVRFQSSTSRKYQMLWIDGPTLKLLRRDKLLEDGSVKARTIYSEHKQFGGVWVPTLAHVYNGDGKLAATVETRDIRTNTGVGDKDFE